LFGAIRGWRIRGSHPRGPGSIPGLGTSVEFPFVVGTDMLRFEVLLSVEVACEESCCCIQRCWFPQTLQTLSLYEYYSNSRLKLPDILSCQAEARRLALTTWWFVSQISWCTIFIYKKGFWSAAAEKLYDGATAETANVVRALAIQNLTVWKRGVHADKQNFECHANRGYWANAVERAHTNSLDANNRLIQTRPHVRNTSTSRKRQFAMRKVKSTIRAL